MTKIIFVFSFPRLGRSCLSSFILTFRKKKSASSTWGLLPSTEVDGAASMSAAPGNQAASWRGWGTVGLLTPYQSAHRPSLEKRWAVMQGWQNCRKVRSESVTSTPVFNPNMAGSGSWAAQSEFLKWEILISFYGRAHSGYRTPALSLFFFLICSLSVLWLCATCFMIFTSTLLTESYHCPGFKPPTNH